MKFNPENQYKLNPRLRHDEVVLSSFSPEEQNLIETKRSILSSIAKHIGKDFDMPVELNPPGAGWYWDFSENVIRIDSKDLLEKPMEYLRFIIAHEGGHRRISKTNFISEKELSTPGFMAMMNSIEDPRMNNYLIEAYPVLEKDMKFTYEYTQLEDEIEVKANQEKVKKPPRFAIASVEYIKQWFREINNQPFELSESLPSDVKDVLEKTLGKAQESWRYYPTKDEADKSEKTIEEYAKKSYQINKDYIWPLFSSLIEKDKEDAKIREVIKKVTNKENDEFSENGEKEFLSNKNPEIPQDLVSNLSEEERGELEDFIENINNKDAEEGDDVIDTDGLSSELKSKLEEYFEKLSVEQKEEIVRRINEFFKIFEKVIEEGLKEQLNEQQQEEEMNTHDDSYDRDEYSDFWDYEDNNHTDFDDIFEIKMNIFEKSSNERTYKEYRKNVLPIIDKLEDDLREIFVQRRLGAWQSGYKSGKRINIKHRIQEKAKGVTAMESKAWERKDMPTEQDYAITLLIDLSGSMSGEKINETFKAAIVLAEALNKLSIKTEIIGFNNRLYPFQEYDEVFSDEQRRKLPIALEAVRDRNHACDNDDGWALTEVSKRLAKRAETNKFLIVLSDGQPAPSDKHNTEEFDLHKVVDKITKDTDQKLIGLGIGPYTEHVSYYYPNSIADVSVEEMPSKLSDLLKEIIENYDQF